MPPTLISLFLFFVWPALWGLSNLPPKTANLEKVRVNQQELLAKSDDTAVSEADLRKARLDTAEARTKYYRAQTEKIVNKP
jgi:hypothetical protein